MSIAFINGQLLPIADARISALDAGIQHGVGLFETLLGGCSPAALEASSTPAHELTGAWAVMLEEHLERLAKSASELGLSAALNADALHDATLHVIAQSKLPRARVRITITGGEISLLPQPAAAAGSTPQPKPLAHQGTVIITATPATEYPKRMLDEGVAASIADAKANPLDPTQGHKTLNYWWRLRELGLAARKDAAEALVFSITNHLVGGCVSNIILFKDGEALTPIARGEERLAVTGGAGLGAGTGAGTGPGAGPKDAGSPVALSAASSASPGAILPSPNLPGITRRWAIDELAGEGVLTHKRLLTIGDVLDADEIVLTNSSWGVLPVVRVEARPIGDEKVGEHARLLINRWQRQIGMLAGV